ncbi:unnamed protein product [marine sediment metagenome]|uniref:Uncharacterized protein n=1 Tax=marine sediment metagenome TaxID=412755 RepID=X1L4P7_9ZZZZ
MSTVKAIAIQPNEVRDFYDIDEGAAAYTRDLWSRDGVVGLDWHCFNDGVAPLTVTLDGGITVTIPAGGHLGMDNTKYAIITVTAVQHRLIIAGVHKRRIY